MEDIVKKAKNEGLFRAKVIDVVGDIEYTFKVCDARVVRPSGSHIEKMIERYAALKVEDGRFKYLRNYELALEIIAMRGMLSEIDKKDLRATRAELLKYSHCKEI